MSLVSRVRAGELVGAGRRTPVRRLARRPHGLPCPRDTVWLYFLPLALEDNVERRIRCSALAPIGTNSNGSLAMTLETEFQSDLSAGVFSVFEITGVGPLFAIRPR